MSYFESISTINLNIVCFALWRRQWHPTPVFLPGKSHGWRSRDGCSPWGRWGLDRTEWHHFHFSLSCIGEGNGNPLQCSCLENPRDGGAWWAAIYRVAESRTWLKWLSSSSSSSSFALKKTLESPLGCKEIKPINLKGNTHWIFMGRIDAEAEALVLWPTDVKRPWCWERLKTKGERAGRGWDS